MLLYKGRLILLKQVYAFGYVLDLLKSTLSIQNLQNFPLLLSKFLTYFFLIKFYNLYYFLLPKTFY